MPYANKRKRSGRSYTTRPSAKRSRTAGQFTPRRKIRQVGRSSYFKSKKIVYRNKAARRGLSRPPIIRGTAHRSEFFAQAFSSTVGANNSIKIHLNDLSPERVFGSGSIASFGQHIDHDAYIHSFPLGMRRVYFKGVKLVVRFTNLQENNVTLRASAISLKPNKIDADWNEDPHRAINGRHWITHSTQKWVMNAGDYTSVEVSGTTTGVQANAGHMITKTFYFPINKWRSTNTGDPSTVEANWHNVNVKDNMLFRIDSDDLTTVDGQYVQMDFNFTAYFYTVNDDQT